MSKLKVWLPILSLLCTSLVAIAELPSEKEERIFRWRDVYDQDAALMYASDLDKTGLDRLNLSTDNRYRQPATEDGRTDLVDAPGLKPDATGNIPKAIRFTVPRKPNFFRAEVSLPHEPGFNARWYQVRMLIPKDWQIDASRGTDIIMQWHAIPGNWRSTNPNLVIGINGNSMVTRRYFGDPKTRSTRDHRKLDVPLPLGKWVTWTVYAKWSPRDDGKIKIWMDNQLVTEYGGPNVYDTIGIDYTPYLKTGIYRPEWNLRAKPARQKAFEAQETPVTHKQVFVQSIRVYRGDTDEKVLIGEQERSGK